jgi:ELWxxDGT repeat protein
MLDETIYGYWWYDTGAYIYYFCYDYSAGEWWQDADGDMGTDDWVLYNAAGTSFVPPFDLPNDSPVNIVPGAQTTDEDTPLIFSTGEGNAITVSDPDAGVYPLEVTLTVEHGTLSLSDLTGLTITSGSDDSASMTVEGSADYINAALNGLEYNPDADYFGTDTLTVITNDLGNIGTGGPLSDTDTVAVTINQLLDDVTMYEIWEGVDGSSPSYLTSFDGDLYFAASDGNDTGDSDNHGNELWRFDPDTGAPEMVADINTSWGVGSNPSYLTVFDGDLYFAANDGYNGNELWRYDPGTGAQRMTDISELGQSSDPAYLTVLNGVLYFSADNSDANGRTLGTELWQYVPGSGASLTANINTTANTGSFPSHLAAFNGAVYFSADDGTGTGYELWKYIPGSGASLVANINTTPPPDPPDPSVETGSYPMYLTVYDGALYFSAYDDTNGIELWTCSTADAVSIVDDINSGAADSSPRYLTVFNGYLYFSADNGIDGTELLRYDTSEGAQLASDINSGAASSSPSYLTGFDGNLYFSANAGTDGAELWRYDSVTETAEMELDINTGSGAGSYPSYLTAVSGELFFSADDGANGRELWRLW